MKKYESYARVMPWFMALVLSVLVAACGGGRDPILGAVVTSPLTPAIWVDLVKPRVSSPTVPLTNSVLNPGTLIPSPTLLGVPANAAITATFTKDMAPASITAPGTFTVKNSAGVDLTGGVVTYDAASRTAIFTHTATPLIVSEIYTARITTAATDSSASANGLAGNQAVLPAASDYVWTFTARAASGADLSAPTVILENPADGDTDVATNSTVNATFDKDMNPATICGSSNLTTACPFATFTLVNTTLGGTPVAGKASYAVGSKIATFTPTAALPASTKFTATITTGAKDSTGLTLGGGLKPNPWTFTTGTGLAPGAANLGSASTFGIMATSAITSTGATMVNGDVSLEPGTSNGLPQSQVNGTIHINDTVSHQARADLLVAYNSLKGMPRGTTVLGGQDLATVGSKPGTLPPGTYTSDSTMLISTPLTLDAGGNANAVWVFQIGSSLTTNVGNPGGNVVLINGAQAKNVFWVPTAAATIGVATVFNGTIVAGGDVSGQTGAVINGRILAGAIGAGTIALDKNTVNVPAQ